MPTMFAGRRNLPTHGRIYRDHECEITGAEPRLVLTDDAARMRGQLSGSGPEFVGGRAAVDYRARMNIIFPKLRSVRAR